MPIQNYASKMNVNLSGKSMPIFLKHNMVNNQTKHHACNTIFMNLHTYMCMYKEMNPKSTHWNV
jgi:hypothetical protein